MEKVFINSTVIQLDQFLKWIGAVDSGGQVRSLIDGELVLVNGGVVHERRKKLRPGDIVEITGSGAWLITGP